MDQASHNLAQNVVHLRKSKGFSQEQLAQLAELPRSNITYIESGEANPSLKTLLCLARGLQISIEELLSRPRPKILLLKETNVPKAIRQQYTMSKLLPDKIPGMEFDKLKLEPRGQKRGTPHLRGTKEYLTNISGGIEVIIAGRPYALQPGDVLAFPGDEPHTYKNPSSKVSVSLSVVCLANI